MSQNISEFENIVAPQVIGAPSFSVTHHTRQAIIAFCRDSYVWRKTINHAVVSANIDDTLNDAYDIDLTGIVTTGRPFEIVELNIDGTDWDAKERDIYNAITEFDSIKETNVKFFTFPDSVTVRLFDISSDDVSILITVAFKPTQAATTVEDFIYEDWLDPITAGALYRLQSEADQAWSNSKMAAYNLRLYQKGVADAKQRYIKGGFKRSTEVQPRTFGGEYT